MAERERRRILRVLLAGAVTATTLVVTGGTGAAAPAAGTRAAAVGLTGLQRVESPVVTNSVSPKTARAVCPSSKKVVGGGGWAYMPSANGHPERLALTRLEPSDDVLGTGSNAGPDGYRVGAAEVGDDAVGSWWLQAYALCADAASVPGWELERASGPLQRSDEVQRVPVGCDTADTAKRVLGTGAAIETSSQGQGQVVLQVARVSADGRLVRAQAHEDATTYGLTWHLDAYAICADAPSGFTVATGRSPQAGSETEKFAHAGCPAGTRLLSTGAAITDEAPAHVALQQVYPRPNGRSMDAQAVENAPYFDTWDFIVARATCAVAEPE